MSLLLSWETPASFYDALQTASSAVLWRQYTDQLPRQQIADGLAWGYYEDTGNDDPTALYAVEYNRPDGSTASQIIQNPYIRRWKRPANSCRVEFTFVRSDSAPWSGRRIKLFDLSTNGWMRDMWSDCRGQAHIILLWGRTVRIEVEGEIEALECTVPKEHTLPYGELWRAGTARPIDERCLR